MAAAPHPLDPLTAEEFRAVAAALRHARALGSRWRFASIELIEPGKDAMAAHGTGAPTVRKGQAVCWNRDDGQAYRAGDAWGCVGRWFAGRWHTSAADGYVTRVRQYQSQAIWRTADFQQP